MDDARERLRPLDEVRAQLADLRAAKQDLEPLSATSFAARLTLSSLEAHEAILETEETAAALVSDGQTLEVRLNGEAVVGNTIEAAFLSDVLGRFQKLFYGVAQAREGSATGAGRVSASVKQSVRMMVAAMVPGSFAVRVALPDQADQLFGRDAIESTLSLFAPDPDIETFLPLMRVKRVRSNFEELAKSLISNKSEFVVCTQTGRKTQFTAKMAQDRLNWIELVETKENVLDLNGVLVGGNVENKTYVLAVDEEHFRGKVLDTALDELRRVALGAQVRAKLLRVVKEQVDGIVTPREDYYLEAIEASQGHDQTSF